MIGARECARVREGVFAGVINTAGVVCGSWLWYPGMWGCPVDEELADIIEEKLKRIRKNKEHLQRLREKAAASRPEINPGYSKHEDELEKSDE